MADWAVALVRGNIETVVNDVDVDSATAAVVAIHGPVHLEMVVGRRDDATWLACELWPDGTLKGPVYSLREKW